MAWLDSVKSLLAQYTSGTAAPGAAEAHFDEVAKSADPATLAQGIAAVMHSDQTPPFASIVSKLFANGSADQKAGMLNALLASASPDLRAQLAAMIPGSAAGGRLLAIRPRLSRQTRSRLWPAASNSKARAWSRR